MPQWIKYLSKIYHRFLIAITSKARLRNQLLSTEEKQLIHLSRKGFLKETGWIRSGIEGRSVDANGDPIPWMSYSLIYFIKERLTDQMSVFEYGSGQSTIFFAKRVKQIISIEHDAEWAKRMRSDLPKNASLIEMELEYGGSYSKYIQQTQQKFDVVIIDGRDRVNCCKEALSALTPEGVIILDNADRERYQEGIDHLKSNGFKCIKFWGMAPISPAKTCSAIFYRSQNCLGI